MKWKSIIAYTNSYILDSFIWFYLIIASYKFCYLKIFLDYEEQLPWSEILIVYIISLVVALIFYFLPKASIFKVYFALDKSSYRGSFWGYLLDFTILFTFFAGFYVTKFSLYEFLSPDGLVGAKRLFSNLFQPNFAIFSDLIFPAVETIFMAFMATALAAPLAFIFGFLAARNFMQGNIFSLALYYFIRFIMNITRAIEPIVWAIIFSVWVGIGTFAGMLAIWLHSVSALTKLYSEQVENINDGPIEAISSTGANTLQLVWFAMVPQIVLPFLSYTIYRWDINVRMATVIGLVGGGGIGTLLMQYQGLAKWREVGLIAIIIAAIVWIMDFASSKIREKIK